MGRASGTNDDGSNPVGEGTGRNGRSPKGGGSMEMGEPPGCGGGVGEGSEVTVVTREENRPAKSFHFCSKQYSNYRGRRHPLGVRDLNTRCSAYRTFVGNPLCDSSLPQSTGVNRRRVCVVYFSVDSGDRPGRNGCNQTIAGFPRSASCEPANDPVNSGTGTQRDAFSSV